LQPDISIYSGFFVNTSRLESAPTAPNAINHDTLTLFWLHAAITERKRPVRAFFSF